MGPGDAYIAAVIVTLFAVSPFNALARVIVVTWMAGELAYRLGVPEPEVNLLQHLAAMIVGARYLRSTACLIAYALLIPLVAIDTLRLTGMVTAWEGWWWTLGLALLQLSFLPFGIEWKQVEALRSGGIRAYWAARPRDFLRVGA